jgi:hypothetical protein
MPSVEPRYSQEEFARRGHAVYERDILPRLTEGHRGQFVAVDIESGQFEVDPDDYQAAHRLRSRMPDAQIWLERVGDSTAFRMGAAFGHAR